MRIKILDNKFVRCGGAAGSTLPRGAMIQARCGTGGLVFIADISGNSIDSTVLVTDHATGIVVDAPCRIANNTFGDALTPNVPQIFVEYAPGPDTLDFQENSFAQQFYSIEYSSGGAVIDARNCWWGDPTGPYHGDLNPNGRGAQVDDQVLFIPWLTVDPDSSDTTEVAVPPRGVFQPKSFSLSAYPNPFNSFTTLEVHVAYPGTYEIIFFDVTGRRVERVFQGKIESHQSLHMDSKSLASGIYFLQLRSGISAFAAAKLVLLR